MRRVLIAITSIVSLSTAGKALAQAAWHDFPPSQSRLRLVAPGLGPLPAKAQELYGDPATKGTRQFLYLWEDAGGKRSYAAIRAGIIATELYSFPTFGDEDVRKTVQEMTSALEPSFPAGRMTVGNSPVGGIRYQRVNFAKATQRQCFAFGGTVGGVHFSAPSSGGVSPGGDKFIMGLFCAPNGETLTEADMESVVAGMSFDDMKPADSVVRAAADHRYSKPR